MTISRVTGDRSRTYVRQRSVAGASLNGVPRLGQCGAAVDPRAVPAVSDDSRFPYRGDLGERLAEWRRHSFELHSELLSVEHRVPVATPMDEALAGAEGRIDALLEIEVRCGL